MKKITADMVKFEVSVIKPNPVAIAVSLDYAGLDSRWANHVSHVVGSENDSIWMTGTATVTAEFGGLTATRTISNLRCEDALDFDDRIMEPIIVPELLGELNRAVQQLNRLIEDDGEDDEGEDIHISYDSMIEALARNAETWELDYLVGFAVHELRVKYRAMLAVDPSELVSDFEFHFGDEDDEEMKRISELRPEDED